MGITRTVTTQVHCDVCGNLWKADFVGTEESAAAKTWFTAVPEKAAAMESV